MENYTSLLSQKPSYDPDSASAETDTITMEKDGEPVIFF